MTELYNQVQEARRAIQAQWPGRPRVGVILGTGLGGLAAEGAADEPAGVARHGRLREVRDVAVGDDGLGADVLGESAQAGAEDDAGARPAGPPRLDGPGRFLNLVVFVHVRAPEFVVHPAEDGVLCSEGLP